MPALLLSKLFSLFLPSFVTLSYFILAVPMRECFGKHSCMSSSFPIAILNGTCLFPTVQLQVHNAYSERKTLNFLISCPHYYFSYSLLPHSAVSVSYFVLAVYLHFQKLNSKLTKLLCCLQEHACCRFHHAEEPRVQPCASRPRCLVLLRQEPQGGAGAPASAR